jgi:O-6-methylguanine DNA methyltransferase
LIEVYVKEVENVWYGVAYEGKKIFATWFGPDERDTEEGLLRSIPHNMPLHKAEKPSTFGDHAIAVLKSVYDGKDVYVRLPKYTRNVLEAVYSIPIGYATSYGLIAKAVGGCARAVGNINARNSFAPLVPCHRVVRSNFSLGGYGGGLAMKTALLRREKRGYTVKREVTLKDRKMQVFPVELVLKKVDNRK